MPRGPRVLTRLRSIHRASRTAARVIPAIRSPMDSSAADNTCACAPHMALTMSAGRASCDGAESACRSSRLAQTSAHDIIFISPCYRLRGSSTPHTLSSSGCDCSIRLQIRLPL